MEYRDCKEVKIGLDTKVSCQNINCLNNIDERCNLKYIIISPSAPSCTNFIDKDIVNKVKDF